MVYNDLPETMYAPSFLTEQIRVIITKEGVQRFEWRNISKRKDTCLLYTSTIGIFFPIYYKFSYAKIKVLLAAIMIFLPTWGLVLLKYILDIEVVYQKFVISACALISINILSVIVILCSVSISIRCLNSKN